MIGTQSSDPCISDDIPYDVTCVKDSIGITLNGASIFSKCDAHQCGNDAIQIEGDTFDRCSGHSTGNW